MNPLRQIALGANGLIDRAADGVKAFSMTFPRAAAWVLLPRTRFNYDREVGQGLGSTPVLAAVGWVSRNFPQAPYRLQKYVQKNGKRVLEPVEAGLSGAGAMIRLLEYPNSYYSGQLMWQAIILDYMTTGNAYLVKIRNDSGRVVELWWIPKIYMRPWWDPNGRDYITYYIYNPNGVPYRVEVDDVIHFRDGLDPRNYREGFNKLAALAREIFTDDEASNYSATMLANLGVPGVVISPENTGMASANRIEKPESVKAAFMEKFSGDKRGEPLILTSPTKVQVLSFSPEQMQLTSLRRLPEERITAVLGVAAIVAGLGAGLDRSTYANMQEAREAATEEKLIPLWSAMASDLKVQLLPEFVGDIFGFVSDFDLSEVRVLQEDQNKLAERNLKMLTGGGITRRMFKTNIGEDSDDLDDVYYIPSALVVTNSNEPAPPLLAEQEAEQAAIVQVLGKPEQPLLGPGGKPVAGAAAAVANNGVGAAGAPASPGA